jgi:CRP-like cAMP-binding protein
MTSRSRPLALEDTALTNQPAALLVRRLRLTCELSDEDVRALHSLPFHIKAFPARSPINRERDRLSHSCLVVSGLLCRAKMAGDGRRQLLSFHIPGDIPDLQTLHLNVMDHDLIALSDARVALIAHDDLRRLTREQPDLAAALWRETLIDASVFREWIVNVGRRDARQRMMHLLFEVGFRLKAMGLGELGSFPMPITQSDLADALGLTPVHVNRVLQNLRHEGLLDFKRATVTINNLARLAELSDFDPLYLHQSSAAPDDAPPMGAV